MRAVLVFIAACGGVEEGIELPQTSTSPSEPVSPSETCDVVRLAESQDVFPEAQSITMGDSLAVDDTHVYWVITRAAGPGLLASAIARVPKAGGQEELAVEGTFDSELMRFVALAGGLVYWLQSDMSSGQIFRRPAAGGAETVVAAGENLTSFAVDGQSVYFGGLPSDPANPGLFRVANDGSDIGSPFQQLASGPAASPLVDDALVYFSALDLLDEVPKSGGQVETLVDPGFPGGQDAERIYFTDDLGFLAVPKAGGNVVRVAFTQGVPSHFVVSGSTILFSVEDELWSVRTDGSNMHLLALTSGPIGRLAVDDEHIYWIGGADIFLLDRGCEAEGEEG